MSETKQVRAFWIDTQERFGTRGFGYYYEAYDKHHPAMAGSVVRVVELPADSVILTRARLREAFEKHSDPAHTIPEDEPALTLGAAMYAIFGKAE